MPGDESHDLIAELLDVYRAAIAGLEVRVVGSGGSMPLSGMQHQLAEFRGLLPPLHQLMFSVSSQRLTGSALLHLLHSKVGIWR